MSDNNLTSPSVQQSGEAATPTEMNASQSNASPKKPKRGKFVNTGNRLTLAQKFALRAQAKTGQNANSIAKQNGISPSTVIKVLNDPTLELVDNSEMEKLKDIHSQRLWMNALRGQLAITNEKLDQASALQLMTMSAIATEKARLMEEKSTSNVSIKGMVGYIQESFDDLQAMKRQILDSYSTEKPAE